MAEKSEKTIGVLLVDDHAVVSAALHVWIDRLPSMMVIGEARNSTEALAIATREQPEVILLDMCLGAENGVDLIPDFLAVSPDSHILVLTGVDDEEQYRRAIRQGAMGVVKKESSPEMLIKAIGCVHAGELWLNRHTTAALVKEMRQDSNGKSDQPEDDKTAQLTSRELEVIALVGEGLKNKQIAGRLCISETTVRHHLTAILRKLAVSDRMELLIYAYRNNLVNVPH